MEPLLHFSIPGEVLSLKQGAKRVGLRCASVNTGLAEVRLATVPEASVDVGQELPGP